MSPPRLSPRPAGGCTWSRCPRGGTASMPVRENTPERAGLRSTHPVSRLHPWIGRRESAGLFARSPVVHWRNRLAAGGNRIRTIGPALCEKGLSAIAGRTDKLDGGIKHRSFRETTMIGRGPPPLRGRLFHGGTDGSNPVCELSVPCGASNFRFGSPAARRPLDWSRTAGERHAAEVDTSGPSGPN